MASRSVQVHFYNNTNTTLSLISSSLAHGEWSDNDAPPQQIAPNAQNVQWGSESDGLATGTQGSVSYALSSGGTVTISWDNPFSGSNSYSIQAPAGYQGTYTGGDGNSNQVSFYLST